MYFACIGCPYSYAQISSLYEPGISVSSGFHLSEKMASETSVMTNNLFRLNDIICACIDLGYSHRSYYLFYDVPSIGYSDTWMNRDAFVLELGFQARLTNIRKLRKVMHPFIGVYAQRHFYEVHGVDKELHEYFGFKKPKVRFITFEIGTELITQRYPHFIIGLRGDLPVMNTLILFSPDFYQYKRKEYWCMKLLVGIRF